MNNLIPQYLDENKLKRLCSSVVKDFHNHVINIPQLSQFVKGLTRRARTIFWCLFIIRHRHDAIVWYMSSKENTVMIMESLFCGRVNSLGAVRKEPDKKLYKVKSNHAAWLFHELLPSIN